MPITTLKTSAEKAFYREEPTCPVPVATTTTTPPPHDGRCTKLREVSEAEKKLNAEIAAKQATLAAEKAVALEIQSTFGNLRADVAGRKIEIERMKATILNNETALAEIEKVARANFDRPMQESIEESIRRQWMQERVQKYLPEAQAALVVAEQAVRIYAQQHGLPEVK